MIIDVRIEANRTRRWLHHLLDELKRLPGCEVRLEIIAPRQGKSTALHALLALEKYLVRYGRPNGSDSANPETFNAKRTDNKPADVLIDLADGPAPTNRKGRILRPLFNGASGEEMLAAILLQDGTPKIQILDVAADKILGNGWASLEAADGIGGAMEAVYSRVVVLLMRVLHGIEEDEQPAATRAARSLEFPKVSKHILKGAAVAAAKQIYNLCCYPGHWRIGWRHNEGDGVFETQSLAGAQWQILPHPVHRFFADPFPFHWQGREFIFFEDLDHKVGKGVISFVEMDKTGPISEAEVIIEELWHLSYPFLIEWQGEIWMIPESSLNHEIALYRAVDFPMRWEKQATLISGVEAADATVVFYNGLWWLFCVVRNGIGGYSDTLSIYHAKDLLGPWEPHEKNPVLIDDRSARPAGNMIVRGNELWRPVQDCRDGYGAALGLARVTHLSKSGFEQEITKVLRPGGPEWPDRKLHTLNRAGRLEVIDGSIYRPKFGPLASYVDRQNIPA